MRKISLSENPSLSHFLATQTAAVLASQVDSEGTIHAAGLLYWHSENPLRFYFVTSRRSEKLRMLATGKYIKAALVIGTEKGTDFTVQLRGKINELDKNANEQIIANYYEKRGNRKDDVEDPDNCLLEFIPNWARFTDYSKNYSMHYLDTTE